MKCLAYSVVSRTGDARIDTAAEKRCQTSILGYYSSHNSDMRMKAIQQIVVGSMVALVLQIQGVGLQSSSGVPADSEIRRMLVDRVDKYRQSVGIGVGVIEPQGRRVIAYGRLGSGDARPLDGDTVFEIGSITKVFTSL